MESTAEERGELKAPPRRASPPEGKRGGSLFVLRALYVYACFPKLLIYPGETYQQAERHEGRHGSSRRSTQSEGKHSLAYHPLEDGEDKQRPV